DGYAVLVLLRRGEGDIGAGRRHAGRQRAVHADGFPLNRATGGRHVGNRKGGIGYQRPADLAAVGRIIAAGEKIGPCSRRERQKRQAQSAEMQASHFTPSVLLMLAAMKFCCWARLAPGSMVYTPRRKA